MADTTVPDLAPSETAKLTDPTSEDWYHRVPLTLRDDVELLRGANDEPLLFNNTDGHYTRLQPSAVALLRALDGTRTGAQLVEQLVARKPAQAEKVTRTVTRFLAELKAAGVLDVEVAETVRRPGRDHRRSGLMLRLPVVRDLHVTLRPLADVVARVPAMALVWVALLVGASAIGLAGAALLDDPLVPDPVDVALPWLLVLPVLMIIHEGSHALVLTILRVPVRSAGIGLMMYILPVGYVDRTDAYRVRGKAARVAVALIGPGVDVVCAGAVGAVVLTSTGTTQATAKALLLLITTALAFNLNPLLPTDGYHAFEAALGGLNARDRAFSYLRHRIQRRPLPSSLEDVSGPRAVGYTALVLGTLAYLALIVVNAVGAVVT